MQMYKALLLSGIFIGFSASAQEQTKPKADFTDVNGIELMLIQPGNFLMGRDGSDQYGYDPELPQREVKVEKAFYLARYETTQALWQKIMGENPADFKDPERPVENVSFKDIQKFITRLNQSSPNGTYRLPTEAQWEYAARAGTTTAYFFGSNPGLIDHFGWFAGNTPGGTQKVGLKNPNPWGLYDIIGNVAEWVEDCWHPNFLEAPLTDKAWKNKGFFDNSCKQRVLRGGSWYSPAFELRSSYRFRHFSFNRSQHKGFRLAFDRR